MTPLCTLQPKQQKKPLTCLEQMHSPLWTSTNEASSSILGRPTCGLGQEAQDRERRLVKQNWYCTMQDFSARENCYSPWSHNKLKQQEHIQKLRGKCFADLKECAETYPWMWEKLYCALWLIQPHTSVVLDQLTVESLEWKKKVEVIQMQGWDIF